jgi:hypothetical protein
MNHGVYTVMKESNEWTISAAGIRIIACRDRRTAIKTARRAAELLRTDGMTRRPPVREARPSKSTPRDLHEAPATEPPGYDLPDTGRSHFRCDQIPPSPGKKHVSFPE